MQYVQILLVIFTYAFLIMISNCIADSSYYHAVHKTGEGAGIADHVATYPIHTSCVITVIWAESVSSTHASDLAELLADL